MRQCITEVRRCHTGIDVQLAYRLPPSGPEGNVRNETQRMKLAFPVDKLAKRGQYEVKFVRYCFDRGKRNAARLCCRAHRSRLHINHGSLPALGEHSLSLWPADCRYCYYHSFAA